VSERRARLALAAMVSLACCAGAGVVTAAVPGVRTSFPTQQGKPFKAPRTLRSENGVLRARFVANESTVRVGGRRVLGRAYNASFPGPTLRLSPGDTLRLTLVNKLRFPTNMHFHGMHVSPSGRSDNVLRTVAPGTTAQYVVHVPLDAAPGTYWYHSHWHDAPLGNVEPQVMGGLSGALIVDGLRQRLPETLRNIVERNLVLKDVQLTKADRIVFRDIDSEAQTTRTVNGQVNPVIRIGPGETQLWRLGNQSADIWYRVQLDGSRFHVIGEDGNPVGRVWDAKRVTLPPGKRYDVLVQGHGGGDYRLRTLEMTTGPAGDRYPARVLATVRPDRPALERAELPTSLGPLPGLQDKKVDRHRTLVFSENTKTNKFFIDGRQFNDHRIDQRVKLGAVEQWTIRNVSRERHPFHIHVNDFQVMSVNGRPYNARGLADTVALPVGGEVVIRMHFVDFTGEYVYHCHILAHEDHGMMGTVKIEGPGDSGARRDVSLRSAAPVEQLRR
jgi:suppressor of ftsI